MSRWTYLIAEGTSDVAFVSRILQHLGWEPIKERAALRGGWGLLLPTTWPYVDPAGDGTTPPDITRPSVPAPQFFRLRDDQVALANAEGVDRMVEKLAQNLKLLDDADGAEPPMAVGIVLDHDRAGDQRFAETATKLATLAQAPGAGTRLPVPSSPGQIQGDSPRVGIYALPSPHEAGALEDVILECFAVSWPNLASNAGTYIAAIDRGELAGARGDGFNQKKMLTGAQSNVLKPEKALAVALHDTKWLNDRTIRLPRIVAFIEFLKALLGP